MTYDEFAATLEALHQAYDDATAADNQPIAQVIEDAIHTHMQEHPHHAGTWYASTDTLDPEPDPGPYEDRMDAYTVGMMEHADAIQRHEFS